MKKGDLVTLTCGDPLWELHGAHGKVLRVNKKTYRVRPAGNISDQTIPKEWVKPFEAPKEPYFTIDDIDRLGKCGNYLSVRIADKNGTKVANTQLLQIRPIKQGSKPVLVKELLEKVALEAYYEGVRNGGIKRKEEIKESFIDFLEKVGVA